MTEQEARIVVLEDALRQAQYTVEFLHNCLMCPTDNTKKGFQGYSYGYPESTLKHLEEWAAICPTARHEIELCFHSKYYEDCKCCQIRSEQREQLFEARKVLGMSP
jgi:hypothetical protein